MTPPIPAWSAPNLTAEEAEIRAWLKANRTPLQDKDAAEVAYLAVLCGFNLDHVCKTLSNFRDAMDGSNIDNRIAFHIFRFEMAVDDVRKLKDKLENPIELDLSGQWKSLMAHTTTGEL